MSRPTDEERSNIEFLLKSAEELRDENVKKRDRAISEIARLDELITEYDEFLSRNESALMQ